MIVVIRCIQVRHFGPVFFPLIALSDAGRDAVMVAADAYFTFGFVEKIQKPARMLWGTAFRRDDDEARVNLDI